jgi:hypothetical protein
MNFIAQNWHYIFGGLATAIIATVLGAYLKYYLDNKSKAKNPASTISQKIQAGAGSTNVQAGGDANVGSPPSRGQSSARK